MAASVYSCCRRYPALFLNRKTFFLCNSERVVLPSTRLFSNDETSKSTRLSDHRTNKYDKWILSFYKKYPKGEVPDYVPQATVEKARNKARIHLNLVFAALTFLGALTFAAWGRYERNHGRNAMTINKEWHAKQKSE